MKRKERLTIKEQKFVKNYIKNDGNGVKTALEVYDTEDYNTAGAIASENLKKPKIQKAIQDALPDELLAQKHLELLNKKEVRQKNNVTTGEIEIVETGEIDVQAVSKALDMAYKLKGSYAPEKRDIKAEVSDNFLTQEEKDKLKALII